MSKTPESRKSGVNSSDADPSPLSSNAPKDRSVALLLNVSVSSVSGSDAKIVKLSIAPSATNAGLGGDIDGALLTSVTVSVKELECRHQLLSC